MLSTTKVCISCKQEKPLDEFYTHRAAKDGKSSKCSTCYKLYAKNYYLTQREKQLAAQKRWRSSKPNAVKDGYLRRTYGITLEDYNSLAVAQNYSCAICLKILPLVVDHDHSSGKVRGLLCDGCNTSLGRFNDDPQALRRAAEYVETI